MGGDGVVPESDVLDVLTMLVQRQRAAVESGAAGEVIDVLSMSLGYYHEQPEDSAFDPAILEPLQELGALGVLVVVAAGNDCTDRPMFPAAFAPWPGGRITQTDAGCLPIISVGALNPNGRTMAMFSNTGPWVTCLRQGAALVSTFPTTYNAAQQASEQVQDGDLIRSTIDPDDFGGGFGTWSGTSFAAPVLAGQLAQALCSSDLGRLDSESALDRGRRAVRSCVKELNR
jgi:subtilisin family serine protease